MSGKQKYLECDAVVNQIHGILSARLCWPSECEHSHKNWSQVVISNNEWFASKMWPQVANKLKQVIDNNSKPELSENCVNRHINECLFALIVLKERDLLTYADSQYYESILDLFDNQNLTFGLTFYAKLCANFNWRSIVVELIGDHKHCVDIIESFIIDIEKDCVKNVLSGEEIYYCYSLIECVIVRKLFAKHSDNCDQFNNQSLINYFNYCRKKLNDLRDDHFSSCLAMFNVLTNELILHSVQQLSNASQTNTSEVTTNKLSKLEGLLGETFISATNAMSDILLDTETIRSEISIARDNYESIQLIGKQLNGVCLTIAPSIERYYKELSNAYSSDTRNAQFSCLTSIITNKLDGYQQLIKLFISSADSIAYIALFKLITPNDVNELSLVMTLSNSIRETKDERIKKHLSVLLEKALKCATDIDLSERLKQFGIRKLCDANCDYIKKLFNQITVNDCNQIRVLSIELQTGIFLDPFPVYDLIMNLALYHNRGQIELLVQLISEKLSAVSAHTETADQSANFLMKFVIHYLVKDPKLQTVDSIVKLVKELNKYYATHLSHKTQPILPLDQFFFYIVQDECLAKEDVVWLKLLLLKEIINLSGDQPWNLLQTDPVPTIAYIIQYLDYFWNKASRKQLVVDILDVILKHKMTRNLTELELTFIDNLLAKRSVNTASNYKIYLAYIEERFPKPPQQIFDLTKDIYHDQILHYASITHDFMWICAIYPEYDCFIDDIKRALEHILPSLISREWDKLFYFLRMYFWNSQVVRLLRGAIFRQQECCDIKFMVSCLVDNVSKSVLPTISVDSFDKPLNFDDYKFWKCEFCIFFKALSSLDYLCIPNDIRLPLKELLVNITNRMKLILIDVNPCEFYYTDNNKLPPLAKEVIKEVYGEPIYQINQNTDIATIDYLVRPVGLNEEYRTKTPISQY